MSLTDFVHLHLHSEYSLLDGLSRVDELVQQAQDLGMSAMALTDHGALYGAIDFYVACKEAGIKPIVGCEAYVAPGEMTARGAQDRQYSHLVLLATNTEGYRNLLELTTRAHLDGYYYKPRVDRALLAKHHKGLIALSGCFSGEPAAAILRDDPAGAREAAAWYRDTFGPDNYYIELQNHNQPDDARLVPGLLELARDLDLPLVATNDSHYTTQAQADAQDMLLCIQMNSTLEDPKRMRMTPSEFYVKSPDEMAQLFAEVPQAIHNTLDIAQRCNLKLQFDRLSFPELGHLIPDGETADSFLARLCRDRLPDRYERVTSEARDRLEYELGVIQKTGFSAYILFVWDFVRWAREKGIVCGPRGSAAGSIVLYVLGVADVNPLEYGLTFERFLNPERIQMPDIDMDFADDRRDEVIDYVVERYGRDHVAQIVTFGRLLARAAIRDVGRAMGYPLTEIDRVAKLVPTLPIGISIDGAMKANRELAGLYESQPHVKRLIDMAKSIEGVTRHASTHAAGVVVSREPLVQHVPLAKAGKSDRVLMTQYHMKSLEKIGLLKMDFLGLANLTMLEKAVHNVEETRNLKIDLGRIPLDDARTYEALSAGETNSVFQLEGRGMTRYIQELKPRSIDHLAAMVSLYRPGPMAHIPSYIARKQGRDPVTYPHPSLKDLLEETYGIIVYQDQVLQIVQRVAGYSLGQADNLRRAMGKKLPEEMRKEHQNFLAGARKEGYSKDVADKLWEYIEPFAGYAFNKAHALCYAFVAYQTAYLKANYPVEWMAAVLTTEAQDTDKVVSAVGECRRLGIPLLAPSINHSLTRFTVERVPNGTIDLKLGIRYGLAAVKNVGEGAVELLIAERERGGPFRSLDDACRRLDLRTINKRVLESMIKCGALDEFGERAQLLLVVDQCLAAGQRDQKAMGVGQTSLFDFGEAGGTAAMSAALPGVAPAGTPQRLAWEKETLGLYFSEHPFEQASRWLRSRMTADTSQITGEAAGESVTISGVITELRRIITKRNEPMARVQLEDLHGSVEVVVFPKIYGQTADVWQEDAVVIVHGKVEARDDRYQLICETADSWQAPDGEPPPPEELPRTHGSRPITTQNVVIPLREAQPTNGGYTTNGNNGHHNGNGHSGFSGANDRGSAGRHLRIVETTDVTTDSDEDPIDRGPVFLRLTLQRTGHAPADIQALERLHALLDAAPGDDPYQVELAQGRKRVRISNPESRAHYSAELEVSLRELLGPENVRVEQLQPAQ